MKKSRQKIAIIGCGYVGLGAAAVFAAAGYDVRATEVNPKRLEVLQTGRSFFYEQNLDELLSYAIEQGRLQFTDLYEDAVPGADIVFSCVGTPDNPDGSSNLSYVFAAAESAANFMSDDTIFVQKSTVPVGTGHKVSQLFADKKKRVRYVSNPEFLREGTAVIDMLWFDHAVVGSNDKEAAETVLDVYRDIESQREKLAKIARLAPSANAHTSQYFATNLTSAELTKVTANAFLALKISFANSIAQLADKTGADVTEVMDAVGADKRIGRAFLNAGRGFGGGCFPKDVSGLIRSSEEYGVPTPIMQAASEVNRQMPGYIIEKAREAVGGSFAGKKVTVLGLSFKPGTSDVRKSPAIEIANTLTSFGAVVTAHDPRAMEEARTELSPKISLMPDITSAIQHADCIFVATDWPEYYNEQAVSLYEQCGPELLVDCMNCLPSISSKIPCIGVGKNY